MEFTRTIGQSCVIKDGSFFHIIKRFDELPLRLPAVIFFLIFRASEVLSVQKVELESTLRNMLPQLATLYFVARQVG